MIRKFRWAVLGLAVGLAGCAVDDSGPVRSIYRPDGAKATWTNVVYVTDREPDPSFPGGYATRWGGKPSCGTAQTIVPAATGPGEAPQYGYVNKTTPVACAKDDQLLGAAIALIKEQAKAKNCHSVFLFVHGFHTGFDGAVLRAAQVAQDAGTGCAIAAFSWSAEIDVDRYVSDLEHSDFSQPLLAEFLRELSESGLRVTMLGHSLGGRLALMTLSGLGQTREPPREGFVDELVLAAPDIGVETRNNDFLKLMAGAAPFAKRTTIYVSRYDSVLEISRREHGGVPRVGNAPDLAFKSDHKDHVVDVIDASEAPADRLDHSYYAMSRETIEDMAKALAGVPLEQRLNGSGDAKPTLACAGEGCSNKYKVKLEKGREPSLVTRLIIHVLPVIPLVR